MLEGEILFDEAKLRTVAPRQAQHQSRWCRGSCGWRRSSLDDLLDVLGLDLGTARGERLHESGVGDDSEGAQGAAGSLVQKGERVLGEYRVLSIASTHAGVDEGKRFVGGEGVDGDIQVGP